MNQYSMNSPIGTLSIYGDDMGISKVVFRESEITSEQIPDSLKDAVNQLTEYFEGKRNHFNLQLNPKGTDFQKKVWQQLQQIPFGKTTSYRAMANLLGDPKVIRAAASANGKNPIAIIIPCHRVIGSDGSLTGYAGGLHRKKWLLQHENPVKQGELF
ncbi:methylated-DNA--[protein]-cysteine S-methyltransferase [Aureisphaera sp. CAU 1614]|uniref:Methylated-DNA--protein-cysteine methyltransferase n=1 Tax=Halomarinibacterium sedimenti TaxID=2857106 RepID=A0A9X1FM67_9FLAO|nr:methylated-DNA--[protein]-cysteine S-methyltransferase [Halomarinibacterium sedimenti]MBW2937183.1 methylated-DNA--[protein]-cysteine S-methyltransferase [Halomarinibacterium sedimenti]